MAARQLSDGNDEGQVLGQSGDKVAFLGGTPKLKYTTAIATGTDSATTLAAANACLAVLIYYGLATGA